MATTLDFICMLFSLGASTFAVLAKGKMDNELLAFSLQILTDVIVFFSFSIRMSSEIENYMTSSQRLFNYSQLESEDSLYKEADINLESEWPSKGIVEFKNVTMRYRESLEPSIRNLSMVI